jgi:hypothetical protein
MFDFVTTLVASFKTNENIIIATEKQNLKFDGLRTLFTFHWKGKQLTLYSSIKLTNYKVIFFYLMDRSKFPRYTFPNFILDNKIFINNPVFYDSLTKNGKTQVKGYVTS